MEDSGVGNKKLLVAWSDEGCGQVCGRMRFMSEDEELRVEIIKLHHDVPAAGHGGRWKTVELVTRNYW